MVSVLPPSGLADIYDLKCMKELRTFEQFDLNFSLQDCKGASESLGRTHKNRQDGLAVNEKEGYRYS